MSLLWGWMYLEGLLDETARSVDLARLLRALSDPGRSDRGPSRECQFLALAELRLPGLARFDPGALVELRENEEAFAVWRTALRHALSQLVEAEFHGDDWATEARALINDELAPSRLALERKIRSFGGGSSATASAEKLTVGALGAAAGWAAGGTLGTSLASATGATLADGLFRYIASQRGRRSDKAIWSCYLLFDG